MQYDTKEARLRPPGQMSLGDLYGETPTPSRPAPLGAAVVPPSSSTTTAVDTSRTQSINDLVAHLATHGGGRDSLDLSGLHSIREKHRSAQVVIPSPTAKADASVPAQRSPRASIAADLASLETPANHDAIVRHFHLRRVIEEDRRSPHPRLRHFTDDDDLDEDAEDTTAEATPTAQRMIDAAKIHEFRRQKSRRVSSTASMAHMIPVSRRRLLRWQRRATRRLKAMLGDLVTPFSPVGTFSKLRGLILLLVMVTQLFVPIYFPKGSSALDALSTTFDVCYIVDFLASCNTAYFDRPDQLEFSRRKLLKRYVKSGWPLWIDLLTSIPADTIVWHVLRVKDPSMAHVDLAGYILIAEVHSLVRFLSWAAFLKSISGSCASYAPPRSSGAASCTVGYRTHWPSCESYLCCSWSHITSHASGGFRCCPR